MEIPKFDQPKPETNAMNGTSSIPHEGVEAEEDGHDHRHAAEDARPHGDPEQLGRDELLGVDGRGEDRVVRRWNWYLTNVPNIAGKALEKRTAVATIPVPMNSM